MTPAADGVRLLDPEGRLVAEAAPADSGDEALVAPVDWDTAEAASRGLPRVRAHPFPTCFVCGPDRAPGDGLRLFPGRVGRAPHGHAVGRAGRRRRDHGVGGAGLPGRLGGAARGAPVRAGSHLPRRWRTCRPPGTRCVIMGEMLGEEGRKARVRTTLCDEGGVPLARALATWVALPTV